MYAVLAIAILGAITLAMLLIANHEPKKKERTLMTDADVKLYRDAANILNRLVNIVDLDDPMRGDMLSQPTAKRVYQWLDDYKKELDKL